jgi:hypothetical protein
MCPRVVQDLENLISHGFVPYAHKFVAADIPKLFSDRALIGVNRGCDSRPK